MCKRVLVVDDLHINRLLLKEIIKSIERSIVVVEAVDGHDALQKVIGGNFDMIFMDIQMPIMSGLDCTRYIRKELKLKVPIIAVTAYAYFGNGLSSDDGFDEVFIKPFRPELIKSVLQLHKIV